MSVVAGCALFDGVLLAADCRMTIQRPGTGEVYVDNVQKLFPVAPGTAIGFVGDLEISSVLLRLLLTQVRDRRRQDPVSISTWLPRLFRGAYLSLKERIGERDVAFMVASALRCRLNVVDREAVAEIVRRIGFGESPAKRNWMPGILVEILKTPAEYKHIHIPGTSLSVLYVMRSPNFEVQPYRPLQFAAIGSGELVFEEIAKYHDMIVAGQVGNSFMEASSFRDAINIFIRDKKIQSVGGLFPVLKVTGAQIEHIGISTEIPVGGTKIKLTIKEGRWIQQNLSTGKEMQLLPPWEVTPVETENRVFDDLADAFRRFRGKDDS